MVNRNHPRIDQALTNLKPKLPIRTHTHTEGLLFHHDSLAKGGSILFLLLNFITGGIRGPRLDLAWAWGTTVWVVWGEELREVWLTTGIMGCRAW
jgi:hypothetical protein